MKELFALLLVLILITVCCAAPAEEAEQPVDPDLFFSDLAAAQKAYYQIEKDELAIDDELLATISKTWKETYLVPDYGILINGVDDPAVLEFSGKHAFVVLGFALADGEMTDELKARCEAAAAAAKAFPDSILVCSGGATGDNNPERHTEAGLMKDYLTEQCGIAADRIFIDEQAMDTVGNALNSFEILKEQGIKEITLVTSDYHQRRANILYTALAEFIRETEGYSVVLTGNFSCEADAPWESDRDAQIAAMQLSQMVTYLRSGMREAREMVINYGAYGEEANERNAELFARMQGLNPENAAKWEQIMALWKEVSSGLPVNENVLPDGLPDTDELCIVALGFQLNPDGSMRDELIERLKVVLNSAEKYPNAKIICTGGGTAAENEEATEAGRMAEWLAENGITPDRIFVEDESKTTAQNAMFSLNILEENCPQVRQLAIVSSDYHIATGTLLFEAESILRAGDGQDRFRVVSNAAYKAPSGSLSVMFQAGALIELSGDEDLAYQIYYDTYDIHELPARK